MEQLRPRNTGRSPLMMQSENLGLPFWYESTVEARTALWTVICAAIDLDADDCEGTDGEAAIRVASFAEVEVEMSVFSVCLDIAPAAETRRRIAESAFDVAALVRAAMAYKGGLFCARRERLFAKALAIADALDTLHRGCASDDGSYVAPLRRAVAASKVAVSEFPEDLSASLAAFDCMEQRQ